MKIKVKLSFEWEEEFNEKDYAAEGMDTETAIQCVKERIEQDEIGSIIGRADNVICADYKVDYDIVADSEKTFTCPHCGRKYSAKAKYMRDEFDVEIWTSTCPNCKELNYISKCYWR